MGNMVLLKSKIENYGLCKIIEHIKKDKYVAITLSGRRIIVKMVENEAIEIK